MLLERNILYLEAAGKDPANPTSQPLNLFNLEPGTKEANP